MKDLRTRVFRTIPTKEKHLQTNRVDYFLRNTRGQALAELIIACAVLAVILMGIVTTINFALRSSTIALNKTLASHYAVQLIEQARGARNESSAAFDNFITANTGYKNISGTVYARELAAANVAANPAMRRVTANVRWFDGTQEYISTIVTVIPN